MSDANAAFIRDEIDWFHRVLDVRFKLHAGEIAAGHPVTEIAPPPLVRRSPYADVVRRLELDPAERLVLVLAYVPHVLPAALDPFLIVNRSIQTRFSEFGGVVGQAHGGFLPTCETALFVLAGADIGLRQRYRPLFGQDHRFRALGVLDLGHRHHDEPVLSSTLSVSRDYVERLSSGRSYDPPFSPEFPAERITTNLDVADLVLDDATRREVDDIAAWVRHRRTLMEDWQLAKRLKPGYRAMFHGPPGTGKTLTACLLGKMTGMPVYRVDLSKVVSKYIGETEKNLASLFDHAQHRQWILFFDEADALFGKRTESRNANDRAANQQIAYLLQRIEDFPGVVILATNLMGNMDEAFSRRFQAAVSFAMPDARQRLRLWEDSFKDKPYPLAADVDLKRLATDHELSGGAIINVLRFACLRAVVREPAEIRRQDLVTGVRRELHKGGSYLG